MQEVEMSRKRYRCKRYRCVCERCNWLYICGDICTARGIDARGRDVSSCRNTHTCPLIPQQVYMSLRITTLREPASRQQPIKSSITPSIHRLHVSVIYTRTRAHTRTHTHTHTYAHTQTHTRTSNVTAAARAKEFVFGRPLQVPKGLFAKIKRAILSAPSHRHSSTSRCQHHIVNITLSRSHCHHIT